MNSRDGLYPHRLWSALGIVALGACATPVISLYPDPARPTEQIATVSTDAPIVIRPVNDQVIRWTAGATLALLPGTHEICFHTDAAGRIVHILLEEL